MGREWRWRYSGLSQIVTSSVEGGREGGGFFGSVPVLRTHERIWQNFSFNWLLLKATIPVFECKEMIINFTKRKFFHAWKTY